jgi:hypothetical protein
VKLKFEVNAFMFFIHFCVKNDCVRMSSGAGFWPLSAELEVFERSIQSSLVLVRFVRSHE